MLESLLSFGLSRILNYDMDFTSPRTRLALSKPPGELFLDLNLSLNSVFLLVLSMFCCSFLSLLSYTALKKLLGYACSTITTGTTITPSLNVPRRRHQIFRALSSFVVPTPLVKSRFPANFLRLAISSSGSSSANSLDTVQIDLALLLTYLFSGRLELRERWKENEGNNINFLNPLELLLKGTLEVDGYRFKLKIGRKIWASVSSWVFLAGYVGSLTTTATVSPQSAPPAPPARFMQHIRTLKIDLDSASYASLETTLKTFIISIPFGGQGLVEFSVLAPQIKWFSTEFVLCAISFRHPVSNDTPTPTPMLLSLKHVIEILSSACTSSSSDLSPLQIISCTNSSFERSSALSQAVRDRDSGEGNAYGEGAWMRKRSIMMWQAAVLHVGWVQRWVVVVSK
ncbi:hypothetical protein F5050DRAFT_1709883 [Lentinula boryana]|uniref:Uncharacterized protein n=1 Tax=Lentinula boryana TaxID=40481 RepID=A0ABQ8QLA2_9AGAR|nr:hypothetical protein F5050DRAFT_1709883 [Lentinula boryana]